MTDFREDERKVNNGEDEDVLCLLEAETTGRLEVSTEEAATRSRAVRSATLSALLLLNTWQSRARGELERFQQQERSVLVLIADEAGDRVDLEDSEELQRRRVHEWSTQAQTSLLGMAEEHSRAELMVSEEAHWVALGMSFRIHREETRARLACIADEVSALKNIWVDHLDGLEHATLHLVEAEQADREELLAVEALVFSMHVEQPALLHTDEAGARESLRSEELYSYRALCRVGRENWEHLEVLRREQLASQHGAGFSAFLSVFMFGREQQIQRETLASQEEELRSQHQRVLQERLDGSFSRLREELFHAETRAREHLCAVEDAEGEHLRRVCRVVGAELQGRTEVAREERGQLVALVTSTHLLAEEIAARAKQERAAKRMMKGLGRALLAATYELTLREDMILSQELQRAALWAGHNTVLAEDAARA
eukprot:RCo026943